MADASCEERISDELASTLETLRTIWQAECNGEEDEELGPLNEYGLCFDLVEEDTFDDQDEPYYRYQLSWGGPSDEFRFFGGEDGEPYRIEYWFLDWFDGAHRTLRGDDFSFLSDVFSWFHECLG